jgi:hypothetical protein
LRLGRDHGQNASGNDGAICVVHTSHRITATEPATSRVLQFD